MVTKNDAVALWQRDWLCWQDSHRLRWKCMKNKHLIRFTTHMASTALTPHQHTQTTRPMLLCWLLSALQGEINLKPPKKPRTSGIEYPTSFHIRSDQIHLHWYSSDILSHSILDNSFESGSADLYNRLVTAFWLNCWQTIMHVYR